MWLGSGLKVDVEADDLRLLPFDVKIVPILPGRWPIYSILTIYVTFMQARCFGKKALMS